jgi:glutathione S-transferase
MIKVHHLLTSRSQRIVWLLEELQVPYEIVAHQRDTTTKLSPPSLYAVHPLGKAPVIEDNGRLIFESGAVIDYILRLYGKGRLAPKLDTDEYTDYQQWMHFAEGSAMLPLLLSLYVGILGPAGAPVHPRITSEVAVYLAFMEAGLKGHDYFLASGFSAADIQMNFVIEMAESQGVLARYPLLMAFLARCRARPAYQKAMEKGGAFGPPPGLPHIKSA